MCTKRTASGGRTAGHRLAASVLAACFCAAFPGLAAGVVITTNTVISATDFTLDNQPVEVRGATLTITGEHTFTELLLTNGGVVTHPANEPAGMSLTITGNCTVNAGCRIDANGRGYPATQGPGGAPNANFGEGGGGGYGGTGGRGNRNVPGYTYGSIFTPDQPGSGGANSGGAGGGRIRLIVQDVLTVDGQVVANGNNGTNGGGSGGSIWITTGTWAGTDGVITAHGGNGGSSPCGAGGGGRIAIEYSQTSYAGQVAACGGVLPVNRQGGAGTVYLKDQDEALGTVTISNCGNSGARTDLVEGEEEIDANVVVTGQAVWGVSRQKPFHPVIAGNLTVAADGMISASGQGHPATQGPGGAPNANFGEGGGGGYGGTGGDGGRNVGGTTYGSFLFPEEYGSGGANNGGAGGGIVRLDVNGRFELEGLVSANGDNGADGGGSGGSVWISAFEMIGHGTVTANAGAAGGGLRGGGGGGRIAVYYGSGDFNGTMTACGGGAVNRIGGAGTVFHQSNFEGGGTLTIANCGQTWTPGAGRTDLVGGPEFFPGDVVVGDAAVWSHKPFETFEVVVAGSLTVLDDGFISANGRGSPASQGPGGAGGASFNEAGGAGHGGTGADGNRNVGGVTYGSFLQPAEWGSGGGAAGGTGGGAIKIDVGGQLNVLGTISANGDNGADGGGGSGGSIWITTNGLAGTGAITASGGNASGALRGGGGGGRIAVYAGVSDFLGTITACGGGPADRLGGAGTVYTKVETEPLGWLIIDNCNQPATSGRTDQVGGHEDVPGHLVVRNHGVLSHKPLTPLDLSVAGDVLIETGGFISANGRGFPAGQGVEPVPSASFNEAGGGGHGGAGGAGNRGVGGGTHGSFNAPTDLGTGGGSIGGTGGGFIRMVIAGTLNVDGTLSANGNNGIDGGGGSGGSIWVNAGALAGSGVITASGGNASGSLRGGGGGGRIAVYHDGGLFTGSMTACGGGPADRLGGAGTVYTKDSNELLGNLIIDNCGQPMTSGRTDMPGPAEIVPGHLIVRNQGVLSHKRLTPLNLTIAGDVIVEEDGFISADGRGWTAGLGIGLVPPAGFNEAGGGGHGGAGADGNRNVGGITHGSFDEPMDFGTGGGSIGGAGGGFIRLAIAGTLNVAGRLSADGDPAPDGGGGSGGSIWIDAGGLAGEGRITAAGGAGTNGQRGGGGGGRIAIYYGDDLSSLAITACGGGPANRVGGAGTVYMKPAAPALGNLIIDNCDQPATGARTDVVEPAALIRGNVIIRNQGVWSVKGLQLNACILGDLVIEPDGFLSVLGRGFPAGQGPGGAPGAGFNEAGGGGYGGAGGAGNRGPGGQTYGSPLEPILWGSGGGGIGGAGGGAVRLSVQGTVHVDGLLGADGANAPDGGGGSGGSVLITAYQFQGAGLITARGGNGTNNLRGGGGGGRIALFYSAFTDFLNAQLLVNGGTGFQAGQPGTIHLADAFTIKCIDPFADMDEDGDVDHADYGAWQACYTGAVEGGPLSPECKCFDRDINGARDDKIDAADLESFLKCFSGPAVPADKDCDGACVTPPPPR